jgi:hypothetical protein
MNRLKLLLTGTVSIVFFLFATPLFSQDDGVTGLWAPHFEDLEPYDSFYICLGSTIYDTIIAADYDANQIITITKISGPGDFSSTPSISPAYGYFSFTPVAEGGFEVVYEAADSGGRKVQATKTYFVFFNHSPEITTGGGSFYECFAGQDYAYDVDAIDDENDPLTFSLIDGNGNIDPITGLITFTAESSSRYCFIVEAADSCGADTAEICIDVQLNTLPSIEGFSLRTVLCAPDSLCFSIGATDPDTGDSLVISMIDGPGEFQTIGDSGKVCFLPDDVDSADYLFVFGVTDRCLRGEAGDTIIPLAIIDSVVYTVIIEPAPALACPSDTAIFICQPDTICLPVGNIPAGANVRVSPSSAWFDRENNTICFYTNCSVAKNLKLVASSICGVDSCQFVVDVTMNQAPLVIMAPDTTVESCEPREICVPVGIEDIDNNIVEIIVSHGGYYNLISGTACFTPEKSGRYYFNVKAADDCGAVDVDSVVVDVEFNEVPIIEAKDYYEIFACSLGEVCIPANIYDPDGNLATITVAPNGSYNPATDMVCFTPSDLGFQSITITAIDSCGAQVGKTIDFSILPNRPPVVETISDSSIFLCIFDTVCFPATATDIDGNLKEIRVDNGVYDNGKVCFLPDREGQYEVIITAVDSCGAADIESVYLDVALNQAPTVISAEDFSTTLCELAATCFDVSITDKEPNIKTILINQGEYDSQTGKVCYTPDSFGTDTIIIKAIDDCDAFDEDTTIITIAAGDRPEIACPGPLYYSLCDLDTICIPLEISPASATVTASMGAYNEGRLCFYAEGEGLYNIRVVAEAECGADTCDLTINVAIGQPPAISCPAEPIDRILCEPGEVCVSLPIANYENVTVEGAIWNNDTLCFMAEEPGEYAFNIIAANECDTASCALSVVVSIGSVPAITCPSEPEEFFICEAGQICVDMPIANYESVTVEGGVWADGKLCFDAPAAGNYQMRIIASGQCGGDTCDYAANVIIGSAPTISCPPEPIDTFICEAGEICVNIPIENYDNVTVEGASWAEDMLCFAANASGQYNFNITASNQCDTVDCAVTINVVLGEIPAIACPSESGNIFLCSPGQACVDIPITGYDTVITDGGLWSDGKLCFAAEAEGRYQFRIIAMSQCGADTCDYFADVAIGDMPIIGCSPEPIDKFICAPGQICVEVPIASQDDVVVEGATWANDTLCFAAETSGRYDFRIIASNQCGSDTCDMVVNVEVGNTPSISCPPEPISIDICAGAELLCIPLEISGADSVRAADAQWRDDSLCFEAPQENDTLSFRILAFNECGIDSCDVTIFIDVGEIPTIVCPPGDNFNVCAGDTICVPVYISPNSEISISNGYYKPGSRPEDTGALCVVAIESGVISSRIVATNECGADTCDAIFNVTVGDPAEITCPPDTILTLCGPELICFELEASPEEASVTVTAPAYYENGRICFMADTAGIYDLTAVAIAECGSDSCNFSATIIFNNRPEITAKDTTIFSCEPSGRLVISAQALDPEQDAIYYELLSGAGEIDSQTGMIDFAFDSGGVYCFTVRASDLCGSDTATICAAVEINTPPLVISADDTTIAACEGGTICFGVNITDAENNIDTIFTNLGGYAGGKICFDAAEAGIYYIITTAVDECGAVGIDSTAVEVQTAAPISLTCPGDTSLFICSPGTICLPIAGIPSGAKVRISPASATLNSDSSAVCFYTNCSVVKNISVVAENECGKDSCAFKANVTMNSKPLAFLAPDTSIAVCDIRTICIPAGVSDVDNNITSITVSPAGSYNSTTGMVCFTPYNAGVYTIILRAVDACGAMGVDSVRVTVNLNRPPQVISAPDSTLSQCGPQEICFPVEVSDPDGETPNVTVKPSGTYDSELDQVCFMPTGPGVYEIITTATDHCGVVDKDTTVITIKGGPVAQVSCPPDTTILLCAPDTIVRPIAVSPEEAPVTILPAGIYKDGHVYLKVDTSGTYIVTVIAEAECGADTCSFRVNAKINEAPEVNAGVDTTYFQCVFSQICRPVSISDADNNIKSITVSPIGSYDPETKKICFAPTTMGTYCLKVIAEDYCGAKDSDEVCITVTTGSAANIVCPTEPFTRHLCAAGPVCVPLTVTPANATVTVSMGTYSNNQICFTAGSAGTYNIRAIATSDCGADTCDITVNVIFDPRAEITCPTSPTTVSLCKPDTVRILVPISPSTATVTVLPNGSYNFATRMVSFYVTSSGTHNRTVIAAATCGSDTCVVTANVTIGQAAQVACPGNIDTTVCIPTTSQICFPVTITPPGATVQISPSGGTYSAGLVCIPISGAKTYPVRVIASTTCGADTCNLNLTVRDNTAPVLTVPANMTAAACDDDIQEICIDGIFATDADGDDLTLIKTCGPGVFIASRPDSGKLCFTPTNIDTTYEFCFQASDGCRAVNKYFTVTVYPSPECLVCVDVAIETDSCVVVGSLVPVKLMISTRDSIGGFDLLISYDMSVMSLSNAIKGEAIGGWEYFSYRVGTIGACGGACPSGLVRLVGIADMNNGASHPPMDQYLPEGVLAIINMRVSSDQNLGGMFLPIGFFWFDCGDNLFSDRTGINVFVDSKIYNSSNELIWDEEDNITYPESNRIFGIGSPDSCVGGFKVTPIRCVNYRFGGICVIHPDSIDLRGDINLNGLSYEIGDAVILTNYFLFGSVAFTINVDGQTAASDVNADGYVLTVADLIYLIRVITGDAEPIPKVAPDLATVSVATATTENTLSVDISHRSPIGGAFLRFSYDGVRPIAIEPGQNIGGLKVESAINDTEIRILIYSYDLNAMIEPGMGELARIRYEGEGAITLTEASFSSYSGAILTTRLLSQGIPDEFELRQNYPNPFNPRTTIEMYLPYASEWSVSIFNVNGQAVRRFSGYSEAGGVQVEWDGRTEDGQIATSGIYFYRAEAGSFSATKKMILLK